MFSPHLKLQTGLASFWGTVHLLDIQHSHHGTDIHAPSHQERDTVNIWPLLYLSAQHVTAHRRSKKKQNVIIFHMAYWHSRTERILKMNVKKKKNQKGQECNKVWHEWRHTKQLNWVLTHRGNFTSRGKSSSSNCLQVGKPFIMFSHFKPIISQFIDEQ